MADNVAITAGAGTSVATDDVGGVHYQIVKNAFGALDTATLVTATQGLPIDQTEVTGSGSLTAAAQAVTLTGLVGRSAGLLQLSGTWVGSIQLEASNDGFATVTTMNTTQSGGAAPSTAPITANGDYRVLGITNYSSVRAKVSAFTSGTIGVTLKASNANGIIPVVSTNAAGFLTTSIPGVLSNSTVVNRSGTITTGGTAQTLATANSARVGLTIQNISTGNLMITEDGSTTPSLTAGYLLTPGASGKVNTTKAVSIWGATTGQAFTATEF